MKEELDKMIQDGIVEPSKSEWQGLMILVKKKDGKLRVVQDFRDLNTRTETEKYPLPLISQAIEEMAGMQWFSAFDIKAAFWQIRLGDPDNKKERDRVRDYTAFSTPWGQYRWVRMPMGLQAAPGTW